MADVMAEMLKAKAKSWWKECSDCGRVQQKFDVAGPGTPSDPQFDQHTCEQCGGNNLKQCDPPGETADASPPDFSDADFSAAEIAPGDASPLAAPRKARRQKYGGPYRKPRADVFTVMLLIALLAIVGGIVCLYLEMKEYGSPPFKGGPSVSLPMDRAVFVATAPPVVSCQAVADVFQPPVHG